MTGDVITIKRSDVEEAIAARLEALATRQKTPDMDAIENTRGQLGLLRSILQGRFPPPKTAMADVAPGRAPNGEPVNVDGHHPYTV